MAKRGRGANYNGAPFVVDHMGGKRYFRRVPADVPQAIGRKVWIQSFDSATPWAACRNVTILGVRRDRMRHRHEGQILHLTNV
jgi:hypothetical protein